MPYQNGNRHDVAKCFSLLIEERSEHDVFSLEAVSPDHARIVGDLHLSVGGTVERGPGARGPVMREIFATTLGHGAPFVLEGS